MNEVFTLIYKTTAGSDEERRECGSYLEAYRAFIAINAEISIADEYFVYAAIVDPHGATSMLVAKEE